MEEQYVKDVKDVAKDYVAALKANDQMPTIGDLWDWTASDDISECDPTPLFSHVEKAYIDGAYWARNLCARDYERLIAFINLINHTAITQEEHQLLDKILEFTKIPKSRIDFISNRFSPEELIKKD